MAKSVLVLGGPTASGKTTLAIALAARFNAEIISADSRQIYRGMPIGTAAPTLEQLAAIPHHLVGFLDPREQYSAALFKQEAQRCIAEIVASGKRAIVVGGTGFYLRALTGNIELAPERDPAIRDRLAREVRIHPAEFLYEWLRLLDPKRAARLMPNDTYRITRALEVAITRKGVIPNEVAGTATELADSRTSLCSIGTSTSCASRNSIAGCISTPDARRRPTLAMTKINLKYEKLVLDTPLPEIDANIERRVDAMLEQGLIEEAERIGETAVAANAVGYPQAMAFLKGWSTKEELRATLIRATRRYARRQRTWFRSEPNVTWLSAKQIEDFVMEHLHWREAASR